MGRRGEKGKQSKGAVQKGMRGGGCGAGDGWGGAVGWRQEVGLWEERTGDGDTNGGLSMATVTDPAVSGKVSFDRSLTLPLGIG